MAGGVSQHRYTLSPTLKCLYSVYRYTKVSTILKHFIGFALYTSCNRLPRLALPCGSPPRMSYIVCLTTYFHYLLPTVSAVCLGNCASSSSSSCHPLRVYIDALELHLQLSRSFSSSVTDALSTMLRLLGEESEEASWLIQVRSSMEPVEPCDEEW